MRKLIFVFCSLVYWCSYSCSCNTSYDIAENYEHSGEVIYGKILSKKIVNFSNSLTGKGKELVCESYETDFDKLKFLEEFLLIKVEIELIQSYKNKELPKEITVYTTTNSASCGYLEFEIGKEFHVFMSSASYLNFKFKQANLSNSHYNGYWTNHCSMTGVFDLKNHNTLKQLMK